MNTTFKFDALYSYIIFISMGYSCNLFTMASFIESSEPAPTDNRSFCTVWKPVSLEKFHCILISIIPYIFDRNF